MNVERRTPNVEHRMLSKEPVYVNKPGCGPDRIGRSKLEVEKNKRMNVEHRTFNVKRRMTGK